MRLDVQRILRRCSTPFFLPDERPHDGDQASLSDVLDRLELGRRGCIRACKEQGCSKYRKDVPRFHPSSPSFISNWSFCTGKARLRLRWTWPQFAAGQEHAERPWPMLNGSGSHRLPIRECEALDPDALEHGSPRRQTRSTDYTTHGLAECQSDDASRVGRYAGRLQDRRDLRGVGCRPGGDIANAAPGQVSLPDVRTRSSGPDDRPCFESASLGRVEAALVLVSAGFGLRGCGIPRCRFSGRRARRIVALRLLLRGRAR